MGKRIEALNWRNRLQVVGKQPIDCCRYKRIAAVVLPGFRIAGKFLPRILSLKPEWEYPRWRYSGETTSHKYGSDQDPPGRLIFVWTLEWSPSRPRQSECL